MFGMNPLTLFDLLAQPEFRTGFVVGVAGLLAALILRQAGWLLTWGVAAFVALAWAGLLRLAPGTPGWVVPVTILIALAGAWAFRVLLGRAPAWSVGLTFALWVLGVWGTVPDTEHAAVTMGVMAAMLPALLPVLKPSIGWYGAPVAIAALGFVTATGGATRTGAMVGALGMIGMALVAAALACSTRKGQKLSPWWLIAAQTLHVILSGRLGGLLVDPLHSMAVVALSALVTGAGLAWGVRFPHAPHARS